MACGFSNFKQNYASGAGFSYSLEWIGTFYRDYWRFMRHFEEVEPGVVCRMINEQLIDRPEAEVRRMLDHLRLPFEASCLEFHKNERAVRTPSAEQVRKPINREGVDYWRHYEPWLDELKRRSVPRFRNGRTGAASVNGPGGAAVRWRTRFEQPVGCLRIERSCLS